MPLTIRLKRHSLPIAGAVTAILVLSVTLSIFYLGLASPPPITNDPNASFYELAYAKATDEQKDELDKIIADNSIGLPGEWRRPVLIAIGDLPKDQPRLTAEQAGEIYDRIGGDEDILVNEFNKIAGAPDFIGGCGIVRYIYYLNDGRPESIHVMLDNAIYYAHNDNGTWTTLPLGSQQLPVNPGPSISASSNPAVSPSLTLAPSLTNP